LKNRHGALHIAFNDQIILTTFPQCSQYNQCKFPREMRAISTVFEYGNDIIAEQLTMPSLHYRELKNEQVCFFFSF